MSLYLTLKDRRLKIDFSRDNSRVGTLSYVSKKCIIFSIARIKRAKRANPRRLDFRALAKMSIIPKFIVAAQSVNLINVNGKDISRSFVYTFV